MSQEYLKRRQGGDDTSLIEVPIKRGRNDLELVSVSGKDGTLMESGPPRTSSLSAPIMQLTGHEGEVLTTKFHPDGETLASAGHDRQLYIWNTYGECDNVAALLGHKGAVLDLCYSCDGRNIFTASTDSSIGMWDTNSLIRTKKFKGHSSIVNCVDSSKKSSGRSDLIVSGSDDCSIKLWDTRIRRCINTHVDTYQILAVTMNGSSDQVIYAGIENVIKVFDLRKMDILYNLIGHFDSVTGLSLSPDGSFVLSNSMDNTLCIWDIRPFVNSGSRLVNTLHGHAHNFEKNLLRASWSPDGTKVSAGSSDRNVYIWDTHYRRILYKLPGHQGSVNDVQFHPNEPIVLSGSSDKTLFLGEIESS